MATLAELLTTRTREHILDELLREMPGSLEITDWGPFDPFHALLHIDSAVLEDVYALVALIGKNLFVETAEGDWLTAIARDRYGIERADAGFTRGRVRVTVQPGFGPYTVAATELIFGTSLGVDSRRFRNTSPQTFQPGTSVDVDVIAENPGAAFNLPVNVITVLHTPRPGMTVTNQLGWVLEAGRDQETDSNLRQRCREFWYALAATEAAPGPLYAKWSRDAHPSVTKVLVRDDHPRGQGTLDVYIAGQGALGNTVLDVVRPYILDRAPQIADVQVLEAGEFSLGVVAIIRVRAGFGATAEASALAGLTALQAELPIGGDPRAWVYRSALVEAMFVEGTLDVSIQQPGVDAQIPLGQAVNFAVNITIQEV